MSICQGLVKKGKGAQTGKYGSNSKLIRVMVLIRYTDREKEKAKPKETALEVQ